MWKRRLTWMVAALLLYVLSSGPMLGISFWIGDKMDWPWCNWAMIPYLPLLSVENENLIAKYIHFWVVDVFGTSFPG